MEASINCNVSSRNEDGDELYEASSLVVVLLALCYGTISVLAVTGNSLVLWTVAGSSRMQRSATNWLLANLALADIIIGLFAVPFQFQAALTQRWDLPHFMCAFCPFVQIVSVNVSIFTLTVIAVRRYRAVVRPLKEVSITRCHARLTLLAIWVLAALFAMPMPMALQVIEVNVTGSSPNLTKPFCAYVGLPMDLVTWYRRLLVTLQYFGPLCIITVVYSRLAWRLWGSRAPGVALTRRDKAQILAKRRIIKMLVLVVVMFAMSWLPLQTYNVLQDIFPAINQYRYINIIWFSCDWLAMSNSFHNPFIYGIYNDKFRKSFENRCNICSRVLKMSPPPGNPLNPNFEYSQRESPRYFRRRGIYNKTRASQNSVRSDNFSISSRQQSIRSA